MMEVIAALVGGLLAGIFALDIAYTEVRRRTIEALSKYLRELASSLEEIVLELRQNRVPTQAGRRIEKAIKRFDKILKVASLPKDTLMELKEVQERLKVNLNDGQFLDDAIRGHILDLNRLEEKEKMLVDMSRTAGYFQGIAAAIEILLP